MNRTLRGMVVVITGVSSGIGRALAVELSEAGARLALAARRESRLEALNRSLGGEHLCVQTDVSDAEQCAHLIDQVLARFGRIDTLVCNAGYGLIRPVEELTRDEIRRIFETNVFGTVDCIRAAIPHMLEQHPRDGWRGQLMIVSSAAARRGLPDFGAYSATKAAQLSLTEALRVELRGRGIAVTSVHPCGTRTEFFRVAMRLSRRAPPRQNGIEIHQSPEEVARHAIRGIRRPVPEVWTLRRFRWLLNMAPAAPAITDWIMSRRRRRRHSDKAADGVQRPGTSEFA
jgi:NAD(P)-dependent dehydrogenase (short-subunit alcohol dehydrogenase family)